MELKSNTTRFKRPIKNTEKSNIEAEGAREREWEKKKKRTQPGICLHNAEERGEENNLFGYRIQEFLLSFEGEKWPACLLRISRDLRLTSANLWRQSKTNQQHSQGRLYPRMIYWYMKCANSDRRIFKGTSLSCSAHEYNMGREGSLSCSFKEKKYLSFYFSHGPMLSIFLSILSATCAKFKFTHQSLIL